MFCLVLASCSTGTGPSSPPEPPVAIRTVYGAAYHLEPLPPTTLTTFPRRIQIGLAEWFPSHGFSLIVVSSQFRPIPPPPNQMTPGFISLTVESRESTGIGLIWRMDSEVTIGPVAPGRYYLRLVRYDPDISSTLHPFGNPRLPVDTLVTVP